MEITQEKLTGTFAQKKELVSQFNLMDDDFFSVVMEDKAACEYLIRKLTGKEDLKIIKSKSQYSIRNAVGHSCVLDCFAEDSNHQLFNIEVQVRNNDNQPKRMRYYRSAIDFTNFEKNSKYEDLPDIYLIMISSFDVFGLGKCSYNIQKSVEGTDVVVNDGVHEMYFNNTVTDGSEISDLLQYFKNSNSGNTDFGALSKAVNYHKETEEGVVSVCQAVEDYGHVMKIQGLEEGITKGRAEGKAEIIKSLIATGMSVENVAAATKLSVDEIKKIIEE